MKTGTYWFALLALISAGVLAGCSGTAQSPDVSSKIRNGLDQAGLKTVSVSQDRDKGVVTLGGHVNDDREKSQAESIAKSGAGGQVVSNEIAVTPAGDRDASRVNADVDKAIEQNLDAALLQNRLHDHVSYTVNNHVVTLKGEVETQSRRDEVEKVAASVPNVQQVVNEIQVKHQKATSTQ